MTAHRLSSLRLRRGHSLSGRLSFRGVKSMTSFYTVLALHAGPSKIAMTLGGGKSATLAPPQSLRPTVTHSDWAIRLKSHHSVRSNRGLMIHSGGRAARAVGFGRWIAYVAPGNSLRPTRTMRVDSS